jgi:hypothetical protein
MLEIGILVFILMAAGYWATLWIMGRRDDVLHGQFVEFEGQNEAAPAMASAAPVPSPVPTRPKPAPKPPIAAPKPAIAAPAADAEALQSLLASIKQELKNAAKI